MRRNSHRHSPPGNAEQLSAIADLGRRETVASLGGSGAFNSRCPARLGGAARRARCQFSSSLPGTPYPTANLEQRCHQPKPAARLEGLGE
uniref:Uncharacterized protein n=1 Tax=Tanacetum cinerariifolium TaxID=118510 RepID=A0A699WL18_TANCI|nr:hypothetical protein [Tanacetum cinerariifolium]